MFAHFSHLQAAQYHHLFVSVFRDPPVSVVHVSQHTRRLVASAPTAAGPAARAGVEGGELRHGNGNGSAPWPVRSSAVCACPLHARVAAWLTRTHGQRVGGGADDAKLAKGADGVGASEREQRADVPMVATHDEGSAKVRAEPAPPQGEGELHGGPRGSRAERGVYRLACGSGSGPARPLRADDRSSTNQSFTDEATRVRTHTDPDPTRETGHHVVAGCGVKAGGLLVSLPLSAPLLSEPYARAHPRFGRAFALCSGLDEPTAVLLLILHEDAQGGNSPFAPFFAALSDIGEGAPPARPAGCKSLPDGSRKRRRGRDEVGAGAVQDTKGAAGRSLHSPPTKARRGAEAEAGRSDRPRVGLRGRRHPDSQFRAAAAGQVESGPPTPPPAPAQSPSEHVCLCMRPASG